MKKKLCALLAAALIISAALIFTGCRSTEDRVASYVKKTSSTLDELKSSVGDVMDVRYYAEGKSLVLEYRYLSDKVDPDPAKIAQSLDVSGLTYIDMYEELARYAKDDSVSVILRYLDHDGNKLLDYVIDKDYVPGPGAVRFSSSDYHSLEDYISSEAFRGVISVNDSEEMCCEASVENGNVLVITYRVLIEADEAELIEITEYWDSEMASSGDYRADALRSTVNSIIKVDGLSVIFRLTDCGGGLLSEYPKA